MKKVLITTGLLSLMLIGLPSKGQAGFTDNPFIITAQAAESQYSHRWETQADGSWKYKLDNGDYATSAWVQDEVDGQWYLLDGVGVMRSGLFESYGRYYLLSEEHDGHFGHLIKNGEVYRGITIQADTSSSYEGALSNETISSLTGAGYSLNSAPSVTGTKHVTNGQIDNGDTESSTQSTNPNQNTNGNPYEPGTTAYQDWEWAHTVDWSTDTSQCDPNKRMGTWE